MRPRTGATRKLLIANDQPVVSHCWTLISCAFSSRLSSLLIGTRTGTGGEHTLNHLQPPELTSVAQRRTSIQVFFSCLPLRRSLCTLQHKVLLVLLEAKLSVLRLLLRSFLGLLCFTTAINPWRAESASLRHGTTASEGRGDIMRTEFSSSSFHLLHFRLLPPRPRPYHAIADPDPVCKSSLLRSHPTTA